MTQRAGSPRNPDLTKPKDALKPSIFANRQAFIFLFVFLINLLLVSPSLMPEFTAVNPDDESKYVESGWRLLRGDIRDLAWGPVVSLVYAPVHLMVGGSPDWFMIETWVGRFLLYAFLWWATFYLGLQFKEHFSPYLMLGVLFVSTAFLMVIINQSDAVFAGFSALALAHLIQFSRSRALKNLGLSSLMVGLAVLARVETIVLLASLAFLGLLIGWRKLPVIKVLLAAWLPALCVLGVFFISSLILVGHPNLGVSAKSYDSFVWNQAVLTNWDLEVAAQETERLFGTEEENQGSVLRAISRNPGAFALRILANAKTIPENYLVYFGKKLGAVLLMFAAWGVFILFRRRAFIPLGISLFWVLHAVVPLGFLALHIVPQVSYLPFIFGAIGIAGAFDPNSSRVDRRLFLIFLLVLLLGSWAGGKPAFAVSFLLVGLAWGLSWFVQGLVKLPHPSGQLLVFLMLAAGLILREPFHFPNYPVLGQTSPEQAIHYLGQALPSQTRVLVSSPIQAIAAQMSYVQIFKAPDTITTVEQLSSWLKQEDVRAVYLDRNRRGRNEIFDLMETGFEAYFERAFVSEDQRIRIFWVK